MLKFVNEKGEFQVVNPQDVSYSYFPLCNDYGMKNSITPTLNGDMKANQHQFMMVPVSQESLHDSNFGRNFWIATAENLPFSIVGNSALQRVENNHEMTLDAGFLWHQITSRNKDIITKILTYVPATEGYIEVSKVTITNKGNEKLKYIAYVVVPLYSRSADNIRDHRHVTALLNDIHIEKNGIVNKPTLSFDEYGHHSNKMNYGIFSQDDDGNKPKSFYPVLEEFIGEGGSLDWPKTIVNDLASNYKVGDNVKGYEGLGAMSFEEIALNPGESKEYVFVLGMDENLENLKDISNRYLTVDGFNNGLDATKTHWENALYNLEFTTKDLGFGQWLKWVTLQPILRRIYGCSFLPHHDYGRGGRGWRDLWQDCLALILMEPEPVRDMLFNNFAGIRMDGTNATIIGEKPGEFLADRNNIPRVWMDHGVWPLVTTKLYIDRTGDIELLFDKQVYFKDKHNFFGKAKDESYVESSGSWQLANSDDVYEGTILEHLLVQNLVSFYNVGDHHMIRLEGADWNDGLDMAKDKGESVAFTAAYVGNLGILKDILIHLESINRTSIEVAIELGVLFDTIAVTNNTNNCNGKGVGNGSSDDTKTRDTKKCNGINYDSINEKRNLLAKFFNSVKSKLSGDKIELNIKDIIKDLDIKEQSLKAQILETQWIEINNNEGFYRGYYDNDGNPLESADDEVKMTLTGQVFTTMYGIGDRSHTQKVINASKKYLYDKKAGGYRLNTDFREVKLNMGRLFGFAYGHKENGAMFSHMATMYSNALYQQGFVEEGFEVIYDLYNHCMDFEVSKIYPGVPEYIDPKGRGMYHYLTGSASWLILTVLNEAYGVKGKYGDLLLDPKLTKPLFDESNVASVKTLFGNKRLSIDYSLASLEEIRNASIKSIEINGIEFNMGSHTDIEINNQTILIKKEYLNKFDQEISIHVYMS